MRNHLPLGMALGAGLVVLAALQRSRRLEQARQWRRGSPGTAAITGASAGIGEAFARALAQEGYDLLLMARREERLRSLAQELEHQFGVQVRTLAVDLSDPVELEHAAQEVESISDLSLLVNNAGFGTGGKFAGLDIQPELKMIRLHVEASVRLTHAALSGMIARGRGGVINVSSMASFLPLPGNNTYGSTKSYLNFFSAGLNAELAGTGVRVQALCPGFTYSEFHDVAHVERKTIPGFLWMKADFVVAESLRGLREGREMVIPGVWYRLMSLALKFPLVEPLAGWVQSRRLLRRPNGM